MNKIEFILSKYKGTGDDDGKNYLVVEIKIDDNLLTDFQYYATDLDALTQSAHKSGYYFILTCWCGIPECVGIYNPIEVKHREDKIIWKITDPKPLNKKGFEFDKKGYAAAIEKVIAQGNELIEQLAIERLDAETKRDMDITPDSNKGHFDNPDKYQTSYIPDPAWDTKKKRK